AVGELTNAGACLRTKTLDHCTTCNPADRVLFLADYFDIMLNFRHRNFLFLSGVTVYGVDRWNCGQDAARLAVGRTGTPGALCGLPQSVGCEISSRIWCVFCRSRSSRLSFVFLSCV